MRRGKKENSRRRRSWFSRGLFLWSESSHSACARATLYSVDQRNIPCHPFFLDIRDCERLVTAQSDQEMLLLNVTAKSCYVGYQLTYNLRVKIIYKNN